MTLYQKGMRFSDYLRAAWKRYAIALALLLGLVAFFMWIESTNVTNMHYVNIPLDNYIPFVPQFVVPYLLWFPYLFGSYVYLAATKNEEYHRMAVLLFGGWFLFMLFCLVYPNGLSIRPDLSGIEHGGPFIWLMQFIHSVDTPTNVCPSMHVYATLCMHTALMRAPEIRQRRWLCWSLRGFVLLIAMSTVFIKQHSIVDVVMAFAYFGVLYLIVYVWKPDRRLAARRAGKSPESI